MKLMFIVCCLQIKFLINEFFDFKKISLIHKVLKEKT